MPQPTEVTIGILVRGDPPKEVLLGWKKRGLGQAQYAGIGGKVETGETPAQAASRELHEEIRVKVELADLRYLGKLTFTFPARPEWNEVAHVFLAGRWQGAPTESAEIRPTWFPIDQVPFEEMWHDYRYWLPQAITGQNVSAIFTYASDNKTVETVQQLDG